MTIISSGCLFSRRVNSAPCIVKGTTLDVIGFFNWMLSSLHTQRKLLNFENWVSGEVSKSAKSPNLLTFKVNFLYQKLSESFSIFFHWRISIFKSLYFLKWCPIFFTSPLTQLKKFNNFLWVCWFLGKNLSNFVPPVWKLHNLYCHNCQHNC